MESLPLLLYALSRNACVAWVLDRNMEEYERSTEREMYMRNSTLVESKNKVKFQQCGTSIHAFFSHFEKQYIQLQHPTFTPQNLV
jgi:hypothetical protein